MDGEALVDKEEEKQDAVDLDDSLVDESFFDTDDYLLEESDLEDEEMGEEDEDYAAEELGMDVKYLKEAVTVSTPDNATPLKLNV